MGFGAPLPARRTLDFAFFGVVRSAAVLRAGLALALPRFELFLRVATRFFAMAVSCDVCRRQANLKASQLCGHYPSATVEHPFGTIKPWMGSTHFQMKTLKHVGTEMALHVLAYNMKRVMEILGVGGLMEVIHA
jgi:hypothetical protein